MTKPRIFVHVPAYRDREMQWTLRDMFEKAAEPERVFTGVCWQLVPGEDDDCRIIRPRPGQVREIDFDAAETRGLGWARQQAQSLWCGEEYSLQIDSHMRFAPDWDRSMLSMLGQCDSPDPVLTHYPPAYDPPGTLDRFMDARVQCIDKFLPNGTLRFTTQVRSRSEAPKPAPTAACAGGFIFGSARILVDVPADPEIYFLGEEPNLAVRLWTHGFDLFSPHEPVIYHYYVRRDGSRPWHDQPSPKVVEQSERADRRLRALCNPASVAPAAVAELGRYGLGSRRSLADYEAFAGVSFAGRTIADTARRAPWVRPPDRRMAFQLHGLQPAPGASLLIMGDEGVLAAKGSRHVLKANESATYVWCALEDGWSWDRIATTLANDRGVAIATITAELQELADHWLGTGLLERQDIDHRMPPGQRAARIDPGVHDLRTYHYRLLDTRFRIRFGGEAIEALMTPALAHLAIQAQPAEELIDLLAIGRRFYLFHDGCLLHHGQSMTELLPILKSNMLAAAARGEPHLLHLHSAAVLLGERLVLLPGRSGSGKTLLTARLIVAGAKYFSDETVLPSPVSGKIRPVPTALSVKAGGAARLRDLFPQLGALPEHSREDGIAVRYMPPPLGSVAPDEAVRPALCVFPQYVAGAATALRQLSPAAALARLLDEAIAIPEWLGRRELAVLVDLAERMPCWEMTSSDLEDAAERVVTMAAQR